jgi:hypothetical protein
MTRPLTGLSGLASYQVQIDEDNQATPEERMGNAADPSHAKYLAEDYIRRGAQMGAPIGPYGPDNQLLGDESWFWEPGGEPWQDPTMDHTPSNRAGPWPKGILSGPVGGPGPDDTAPKLAQLAALHAIDTNADRRSQTGGTEALNDDWETIDQLNPGNSDLATLPKQSMSSGFAWGTRDRTQSMGAQNEFGFDSSHQHRRFATGGIPGNTMWLQPGGRPMVKSMPGPARPAIGPDSPFAGQNLGAAFDVNGSILQNVPAEYVPPPQPTLSQAVVSPTGNDSIVEWY